MDGLDAIAKHRDDTSDIGELKRLVAVLLQEINEWPPSGLLLAGTDHSKLLDPATWRRFAVVVEFPLPDRDHGAAVQAASTAGTAFALAIHPAPSHGGIVASHSDAVQAVTYAQQVAAVEGCAIEAKLKRIPVDTAMSPPRTQCQRLALALVRDGIATQRLTTQITGVSRDTIRKGLALA